MPIEAKVKAISEFPLPDGNQQLMRFVGMAGYYRKSCSIVCTIAEPLTNLLRKRNKFIWSERCQQSFDKFKVVLISVPVLSAPNFNCRFKLAVDLSNIGAGSVLLQEDENGVDHPVCYLSKNFNASQMNYSTIEKECLSLVLAVQHFEVYLTSSSLPIVVYGDHNLLTFINKMKNNKD